MRSRFGRWLSSRSHFWFGSLLSIRALFTSTEDLLSTGSRIKNDTKTSGLVYGKTFSIVETILVAFVAFITVNELKVKAHVGCSNIYSFNSDSRLFDCALPRLASHKLIT
jgi:hypothetical protein